MQLPDSRREAKDFVHILRHMCDMAATGNSSQQNRPRIRKDCRWRFEQLHCWVVEKRILQKTVQASEGVFILRCIRDDGGRQIMQEISAYLVSNLLYLPGDPKVRRIRQCDIHDARRYQKMRIGRDGTTGHLQEKGRLGCHRLGRQICLAMQASHLGNSTCTRLHIQFFYNTMTVGARRTNCNRIARRNQRALRSSANEVEPGLSSSRFDGMWRLLGRYSPARLRVAGRSRSATQQASQRKGLLRPIQGVKQAGPIEIGIFRKQAQPASNPSQDSGDKTNCHIWCALLNLPGQRRCCHYQIQ